jgi:hypothetical protein
MYCAEIDFLETQKRFKEEKRVHQCGKMKWPVSIHAVTINDSEIFH